MSIDSYHHLKSNPDRKKCNLFHTMKDRSRNQLNIFRIFSMTLLGCILLHIHLHINHPLQRVDRCKPDNLDYYHKSNNSHQSKGHTAIDFHSDKIWLDMPLYTCHPREDIYPDDMRCKSNSYQECRFNIVDDKCCIFRTAAKDNILDGTKTNSNYCTNTYSQPNLCICNNMYLR